jgi:hypothetical protein
MRELPIVGVDPGGAQTGIVVRAEGLHRWMLVTRTTPFDDYLREVTEGVLELKNHGRLLLVDDDLHDFRDPVVAVEDINDPTPQMGVTSVRGLIDTAQVLGALAVRFTILRVPPGGHGSGPLTAYPQGLRGEQEKIGTGKLRHCRSAWDIAGTARTLIRQEATG